MSMPILNFLKCSVLKSGEVDMMNKTAALVRNAKRFSIVETHTATSRVIGDVRHASEAAMGMDAVAKMKEAMRSDLELVTAWHIPER